MLGTLVLLGIVFIIVVIHEAGHLIVAKKCNVHVTDFAIGFGPRIIGFKFFNGKYSYKILNNKPSNKYIWNKAETEYKICPLPFGGYCAMVGEIEGYDNPRALANKPFMQKFAVAMGGCFFNIVTGVATLITILSMKLGILNAIKFSYLTIRDLVIQASVTTGGMITGQVPLDKWSDIANASASMVSFEGLLLQFSIFSIILAMFNLIPFPALDGSLPFLWSIEKFLGKKRGQKIANIISKIGFMLLMSLQLFMIIYWIVVR